MIVFLTYQNSTYGIKIRYPSDWSVEEAEEKPEKDAVIGIVYIYPPIAADPKVITYFYVGTWDLARKTTNIDLLARNAVYAWRAEQGFKLISANAKTTLAGKPAYAIVRLSTDATKYDDFVPEVQKMISAFELTPMKQEDLT
jgi:hypothetical protein